MSEVADLWVVLRANTTGFKGALAAAGAEGEAFTTKMERARMGLVSFGKYGALALGAIGYESLKMGSNFEAATERIRTQAGTTQANVDRVRQQLLKLAPAVGYGPEKLAKAMYHVESAGYRGAKALDVVTRSAQLAKVGNSDLEDTTNALVGILQNGIVKGANAVAVATGQMNAIVGAGNMKMGDFVDAMKSGLPSAAKTFGMSLESLGAPLALMTDESVPAGMAANRLRMSLSLMAAPTKIATTYLHELGLKSGDAGKRISAIQKVLQETGVRTTQLANDLKKPDGFLVALTDIKTHAQAAGLSAVETSAMISRSFGGGRSGAAIMQMYTNLGLLQSKFDKIRKGSDFSKAWAETQNTLRQQVAQSEARIEAWLTRMGMVLIPYATKALQGLGKAFDWLGKHKDVAKALEVGLGVTLVAGIGLAVAALAEFIGAAGLVVAAVAAAAAGLEYAYEHCATFRTIVIDTGKVLKNVLGASMSWIAHTGAPALVSGWQHAWRAMGAVVSWFANGPLAWIKGRIADLRAWFSANGAEIQQVWSALWITVSTIVKIDMALVVARVKTSLAVLRGVWVGAWHLFVNTLKVAWDAIAGTVTFYTHLILNTIAVVLDLMTGHWSKAWGDLKHLVVQALGDVIHTLQAWVADIVSLMYNAGKDAVNGFVNGIKAMGGAVADAAKGIGNSAVDGIKGLLKIHSPSRVFHELGLQTGQGFVDGMNASRSKVDAAARRLITLQHKKVSGFQNGLAKAISGDIARESAIAFYSRQHPDATGQTRTLAMWQQLQAAESKLLNKARAEQAKLRHDPHATAGEKHRAASQIGEILRTMITTTQRQLATSMSNNTRTASGIRAFAQAHTSAGGQSAALKMWDSLNATEQKLLHQALVNKTRIDRDPAATAAQKRRAITQIEDIRKQLVAANKLHTQLLASEKAALSATRQRVVENFPSYLAIAASAGWTASPTHAMSSTITVPIVVVLDGAQIHQETQKRTLRHERRNVSNGQSRYTRR